MILLNDLSAAWQQQLADEGRSDQTRHLSQHVLAALNTWYTQEFGGPLALALLTTPLLAQYAKHLRRLHPASTVTTHITTLHAFGAWLVATGTCESNPAALLHANSAPRAAQRMQTARRKSWQIVALVALLLGLLGLGGWWLLGPGRGVAGGTQTAQAGDMAVTLQVDQLAPGQRVVDVFVRDANDAPASISALRLRFSRDNSDSNLFCALSVTRNPDVRQVEPYREVTAEPISPGHFQARGAFFPLGGTWKVETMLQRPSQALLQTAFALTVDTPRVVSSLGMDSQALAAGAQLYRANCASCHGSGGRGDGPTAAGLNPRPANLAQHMVAGFHSDNEAYLWINNGAAGSAMPAFSERLNNDEIWQLIAYIRSLADPQAAQDALAGKPPLPDAATQPNAGLTTPLGGTIQATPQQSTSTFQQVPDVNEPLPPIVFATNGGLWQSSGAAGSPTQLLTLPEGSFAEHPSLSPDGSLIAFVSITQPPVTATVPLPSAALHVMDADGSNLRTLWQPAEGLLTMPTWTADGTAVYLAANGARDADEPAADDLRLQIVRVELATGAHQPILDYALDPSISRDGTQLAYLALDPNTNTLSLEVAALDGSNPRTLIDGVDFMGLYAPRFSPDGTQIIVAGSSGPDTDDEGHPIKQSSRPLFDRLAALFVPATAEAHGLPWDLWSVSSDGSGLRKLTNIYEDLPMVAFSPDGSEVAVMGYGGIYRMKRDGSDLRRVDRQGDHGGLDWRR